MKTTIGPADLAGNCVSCGRYVSIRSAGWCDACISAHNQNVRAERKQAIQAAKTEGRAYWASRGIEVGEQVRTFARSWIGLGGTIVTGTAKVGACGAYVSSAFQPGHLDPNVFHKIPIP